MSNSGRQYLQQHHRGENVTRSDALLRKVREYFREVDTNNDNLLSREEFTKMANTIGVSGMDVGNLHRAYDHADADHSGTITFREFLDAYATSELDEEIQHGKSDGGASSATVQSSQKPVEKKYSSSSEDAVLRKFREYFRELDVNGDNMLSRVEFTQMVSKIGMELEVSELRKAYDRADTDGSGTITFKEFIDCYKSQMNQTARPKDSTHTRRVSERTAPSKDRTRSARANSQTESSSTQGSWDLIQKGCRYFWNSDQDNDGKLSLHEFTIMINALGMKLNTRDITKAFRVADVDGSGFMHFGEYMRAYLVKITTSLTNAKIKEIFVQNDTDGKGYLNREEFRATMKKLGNGNLDERGLDKLISSACQVPVQNGGGKVSWKDFCDLLGIDL